MASQVTGDGSVVPPLNISIPAPSINLKGFRWGTVDEKLHVAVHQEQSDRNGARNGRHEPERLESEQKFAVATDGHGVFEQAGPTHQQDAKPAAPLAPHLPDQRQALGHQLRGQLGLEPGDPAAKAPLFPLTQFQGAYAGNGFNTIFRPRPNDDQVFPTNSGLNGPPDNVLELNITTEQLTFGETIGDIPNRGLGPQSDITLGGFPYLQTIQDVTNPATGKGDNPIPTGIHFETGMWLNVPDSAAQPQNGPSVVRMASIPHGTTINAQSLSPPRVTTTVLGGSSGGPNFDDKSNIVDSTPFQFGNPSSKVPFPSMQAENPKTFRIPQNLQPFIAAGTITTDIIKNPNLVLKNAIQGQDIIETISFTVSTGPPASNMNGGGTANISFLAGKQQTITTNAPGPNDTPNAHAALMTAKFWIETVAYKVRVPRLTTKHTVLLKPIMANDLAPTPVFAITPTKTPCESRVITVPGVQIQYSQTVNLNFGPPVAPFMLTWPHISVATLVPTDPQPFTIPA